MSGFVINRPVFFGAVGIIMVLLGVGTFLPQQADAFLTVVEKGILAQSAGSTYLRSVSSYCRSRSCASAASAT